MEIDIYDNKILMKHFMNPSNVGKIDDADGIGTAGNPSCSDYVKIYIKIDGHQLTDIKYQVHGCPAAIATSSVFSELVKGKPIMEALDINDQDVVEALSGLPEQKLHCSCMAVEAFDKAVIDWVMRILPDSKEEIESMVEYIQRRE
ncbi:iron-sulfur cluster assembly scaffold protein [Pelotomaculum terephthalicicum JT]|uniref:iron-sulfur cluster assembly scaffold protein n=1 Tax=Pelotomaculum TaxID=191373 RepID=UPI0009D4A09E|nr:MULTISPECIES: iron-sulfur cluster assembly scaffold protein [Pelotomaculum]MCG9969237.1 iron-sulfur cluster assembly scaffold protein [Pelotomaculum terephthalicicum JT]OPX86063.1 MAG: NifU-like protein [Pelotomaculum sp. PtaB.Bin117]OPY61162.1 MAG: NifU-like protein [Pelotomaculum sp. PtaU1.Bin065]